MSCCASSFRGFDKIAENLIFAIVSSSVHAPRLRIYAGWEGKDGSKRGWMVGNQDFYVFHFISFTSFRFGKQMENKERGKARTGRGNQDFSSNKEANIMKSDHTHAGI